MKHCECAVCVPHDNDLDRLVIGDVVTSLESGIDGTALHFVRGMTAFGCTWFVLVPGPLYGIQVPIWVRCDRIKRKSLTPCEETP